MCVIDSIFFCAVVYGTITVSSWSCPYWFWPLLLSTPITLNGRLRIRIVNPTGSVPAKRLSATVFPITHTRAAVRTCVCNRKDSCRQSLRGHLSRRVDDANSQSSTRRDQCPRRDCRQLSFRLHTHERRFARRL